MQKTQEVVLYYHGGDPKEERTLYGILVRLGIRIRKVGADQVLEQVGFLAGIPGYEQRHEETEKGEPLPAIPENVLVMKNFTGNRMDVLLRQLRAAKPPLTSLKAVITPTNAEWTFYHLYEELKEERSRLTAPKKEGNGND